MKKWKFSALLIFLFCLPLSVPAQTKDVKKPLQFTAQKPSVEQKFKPRTQRVIYIPPPPKKRAPSRRHPPGGTRTVDTFLATQSIQLYLLSPPDHIAHTVKAQPTLYWHISRATDVEAVFTLTETDKDAVVPLIEKTLPTPVTAGFHAVRLADFGKELKTGKVYEWSICLVNDSQFSSVDIVEKAFIERVPENTVPESALSPADCVAQAKTYAERGIWYESLESVMETGAVSLCRNSILEARSDLLKQAGLTSLK